MPASVGSIFRRGFADLRSKGVAQWCARVPFRNGDSKLEFIHGLKLSVAGVPETHALYFQRVMVKKKKHSVENGLLLGRVADEELIPKGEIASVLGGNGLSHGDTGTDEVDRV